ncbi:MAG: HEAT repeat domain-containing protein [Clostridiales bacterium]|nr:HEAT repeat domain-containing protein [Clostridiales bacterium]
MNLQPLYDVKERLEYAAIAGVGLLGEDFRLQRAAQGLKPLASASPVFAKIDSSLDALLSAPAKQRAELLLDTLALVDAVAYTQASAGLPGEIESLPVGGGGTCQQISYGQLHPLLTALTSTGGGRMEIVKSTWESHPAYFSDFRVLPALVAGLGDSYSELAELNAEILKKQGPSVLPLLKKDFDPAGKRDMERRVEVIAKLEGAQAVPWLHDILPQAKKEVRAAVITALGRETDSTSLLLDLVKSERGKCRDAALQSLALHEGDAVRDFWTAELKKNELSFSFLSASPTGWSSDLVAAGLRERLENLLARKKRLAQGEWEELNLWHPLVLKKTSPAMLDLWRWIDDQLEVLDQQKNAVGQPLLQGSAMTEWLLNSLCHAGPGPLCDLCRELWEKHPDQPRYLPHALLSALMTRPAAAVYEEFAPYIQIKRPLTGSAQKQRLHGAVLKAFAHIQREESTGNYTLLRGGSALPPLDPRWISRLLGAVWRTAGDREPEFMPFSCGERVGEFDMTLVRLADASDQKISAQMTLYLRRRMAETGAFYSYGRWLLQFHGDFRDTLAESLRQTRGRASLYYIWELFSLAAASFSPEELAAGLEKIPIADGLRAPDRSVAQKVIPLTVASLRAGEPFPEWSMWRNMR